MRRDRRAFRCCRSRRRFDVRMGQYEIEARETTLLTMIANSGGSKWRSQGQYPPAAGPSLKDSQDDEESEHRYGASCA